MNKRAVVLGATGLVGGHLLRQVLDRPDYGEVRALVRHDVTIHHPKLHQVNVDFDRLWEWGHEFQAEHVFCCLGTTRAKAGTRAGFERVDYGYVHRAAQLSAEHCADRFVWVSAAGANPRSLFFYPRVKGRLEVEIGDLGLQRWTVVRPSLLMGRRHEPRLGEMMAAPAMQLLRPIMVGPWRKYRAIHAETVAAAMLAAANDEPVDSHLDYRSGGSSSASQ
ncbi:MAG: NAD(P)H-binding protein [Nitrospirota bacterium]